MRILWLQILLTAQVRGQGAHIGTEKQPTWETLPKSRCGVMVLKHGKPKEGIRPRDRG